MGGKSSLSTSSNKLEALQFQSSAYGVTIPVVGGVTRVAGNLIYYNDFKAIPQSTKSSGKGGGKPNSGQYNYQASCIMAICHGQIADIPRIWKGSAKFPDATGHGAVLAGASETFAVPSGGGQYTVTQSTVFGANRAVRTIINGRLVILSEGKDYTHSNGVYTFGLASRALGISVSIAYTYLTNSPANNALSQLHMTIMRGTTGQAAPSWVSTNHPSDAMGYSGVACVSAQNYPLSSSGSFDNHNFEVVGPGAYSIASNVPDIDPSEFSVGLLTNSQYGASFPAQYLGDATNWSNYCLASNFLMSPCLDKQTSAADFLKTMAQLTNTGLVWSGNMLKFIPYGDTTVTGNGVTFTPNTTPVYDLTDDVFITSDGDPPVSVTRSNPSTAYNNFTVQFKNRANEYATETAQAEDDANVNTYGRRPANVVTADWIMSASVARSVAQTMMQRSVYVRASYEFTLPWNFAFLEPMDLVTITDTAQGFNKYAVRITSIEEDGQDYKVKAEDFMLGVAHAALYDTQVGAGFVHNFNEIPGSVSAPVIFEAPRALSSKNGLDVWIAANSSSTTWGGCNVWVSLDGTNYRQAGTITGGSRFGSVSNDAGTTLGVTGMTDALTSGSASDSANLTTLCYVGGATPEFLAYQTASLTGAGAYTLGGLTRPAYGTAQSTHANGDPFVRCDTGLLKALSLDSTYVGKTLHVKFTSFNVYGGAEEEISAVTEYTYTVTGAQLRVAPAAPPTFNANPEPFGIRLSCTASPDPTVANYQYRSGPTWATASVIEPSGSTSYLWKVQATGSYTLWCAAVDSFGNVSVPLSATATVVLPSVSALAVQFIGARMALTWAAPASSFNVVAYEVRYGSSWTAGTSMGSYNVAAYNETVTWPGNRTYWVAPIDANGNYGAAVSIPVNVTVPGGVLGTRADVVDNDALLYWAPPATGTFPIDHYEVRKGSTWAGGQVVGSNGNSTFTMVFEQVAGTFTYWIAPWDTAGNMGTPVSLSANILQPPDYVLRVNYQSGLGINTPTGVLSAVLVNMYPEQGTLVGPADLTKTWATHFSGNSWTSPNDQVNAGYVIYAEPSIASGTYTEVFDYGTVLQATTVTVTPTYQIVAGSEALTCQIYTSTDNTTYTAAAAGFSALVSNFRYIKYVITVTGTPGANLAQISAINVKLSIKQRNDSGSSTSVISGTTGVVCNFGYPFIEADTPIVQCNGVDSHGKPYAAAVIYAGTPNPTSFSVRIFDSTGTEVSGVNFSWTVRGY